MNTIFASKFARLLHWADRQSASSIELASNELVVKGSIHSIVPVSRITAPCKITRGLLFNSVVVVLEENSQVRLHGVNYRSGEHFVKLVNGAWYTILRKRFAENSSDFQQIANVTERLENPIRYPSASLISPYFEKAETLSKLVPSPLPEGVFPDAESEQIKATVDLAKNVTEIRSRGIPTYIERELESSKSLFDSVESNPLTYEQRLSVVMDEDATLVLASAGSGKTSVLVAKVAHLIKRKIRNPDEILLLAFGSGAAKEMLNRITNKCGVTVDTRTFHALGYEIIQNVEGQKPTVADYASDEAKLRLHLNGILKSLTKSNPWLLQKLLSWFSEHLEPYRNEWDFRSKREYYEYVSSHEYRTFQGEKVKSHEELMIANWLYSNGVNYEYEREYEFADPDSKLRKYQPDFYLSDYGVYLEHFGVRKEIDSKGDVVLQTAPFVDRSKYLEGMKWKRNTHRENNTVLIETYSYEQIEGNLLSSLAEKLKQHNVRINPKPDEEILQRLVEIGQVDKFTDILATFLKHFKDTGISITDCQDRIGKNSDTGRNKAFLGIFEQVYEEYQRQLGERIDFEDMIRRATQLVESGRFKSPYRHILIDEFQDISVGRAKLLQALKSQHTDARIFAVGDDWQSIYRFAGSNLDVMRNFGELFGASLAKSKISETVDLGVTFRCVDRISDAARRFVLKNSNQFEKQVRSVTATNEPAITVLYAKFNATEGTLLKLLDNKIECVNFGRQDSILLLGRYRKTVPENLKELQRKFPNRSIKFNTIHSSKGLEADHVILLGANSGRFPSEIVDDPILDLVLPESEIFPHAEERRLFYVALTRARMSVVIIANEQKPSCFVEELTDDSAYGVQVVQGGNVSSKKVRCPNCQGSAIQITSRDGKVFYKCTYEDLCDTICPACSVCGSDLPVANPQKPNLYVCSCGANYEGCPSCKSGWLVERIGKFGKFLGCVNYPECDGTKNIRKRNRRKRKG